MAFRLLVQLGDRTVRFALEPGRQMIGPSPECPVQIVHPTLSRRHAAIEVAPDGVVTLADLGSTNGTRVDGRVIAGPTPLAPGARFSLGSVEAVLESLGQADLEVGVSLSAPDREGAVRPKPAEAVSTVGPAALETFALGQLPELLDTGRLQPVIAGAAAWHGGGETLSEVLDRAEREHVARVLQECGGVVPAVAKRLGIGVSTLYRRLRALDLD